MKSDAKQLRVLLVEDSPLAAEMMSSILRNDGFDVAAVVADGPAALAATRADTYDLAIVDLELPGTDLVEMLEGLRSNAPGARLVACSAHARGSARVKIARVRVDSVISKSDLARSGQLLRNLCSHERTPAT